MEREIKQETEEESIRRSQVLAEVKRIFLEWVKHVAVEVVHLPEDEAVDVGGELFVSGSHKLNVREPGADIDTICVAPNFCLREHFFTSLKERFLNHPDVTNLTAVESAKVPLLTFDFREVNIDLLFARMAENSIPPDINERIFEDEILKNLDEASVMSVNGPRATYMISRLVPNYDNFLIVLRCIRVWAKRRGLYGNKFGYLGGINCNILVAFVCQLYPEACPSTLLHRFFRVYSSWNWPLPIKLNHIKPNMPGDDFRIWSEDYDYLDKMPMITPSYPAMNSAKSVSDNSLRVMSNEFSKGNDIMTKIIAEGGDGWERLFVPSGFFVEYDYYLACHILSPERIKENRYREWKGLLQSVLRFFPEHLQHLPIENVHLFPREFPSSRASKNASCYYIGFSIDSQALQNKEIDIYQCEQEFWEKRLSYFRTESDEADDDFDFVVDIVRFKALPDEVFESLGGRACAKMMRDLVKEASRSKKSAETTEEPTSTANPAPTPSKTVEDASNISNKLMTPQSEKPGSSAKEILTNTLAALLSSDSNVTKKLAASFSKTRSAKKRQRRDEESSTGKKKTRFIRDLLCGVDSSGHEVSVPKRDCFDLLPAQPKPTEKNIMPVPSITWNLSK